MNRQTAITGGLTVWCIVMLWWAFQTEDPFTGLTRIGYGLLASAVWIGMLVGVRLGRRQVIDTLSRDDVYPVEGE